MYSYTDNAVPEKKNKTVLFPKASEAIKYYRINVTKEEKDLYTEDCKTLMKETENTNKLKNNPNA